MGSDRMRARLGQPQDGSARALGGASGDYTITDYTITDLTELFSVSRPTVYRTLQRGTDGQARFATPGRPTAAGNAGTDQNAGSHAKKPRTSMSWASRSVG